MFLRFLLLLLLYLQVGIRENDSSQNINWRPLCKGRGRGSLYKTQVFSLVLQVCACVRWAQRKPDQRSRRVPRFSSGFVRFARREFVRRVLGRDAFGTVWRGGGGGGGGRKWTAGQRGRSVKFLVSTGETCASGCGVLGMALRQRKGKVLKAAM